uniref:Uncharacterized protein n=1 Tax=Rousettus aegyptiacus TaxID=9407 RepID=A0A7J8C2A5_ROUAE|nr:hypothetical protein HJG63_009279 [Rousettus aegyptiacus]
MPRPTAPRPRGRPLPTQTTGGDQEPPGTGDAVAGTGRADGRCRIHVPAPRRSPAPAGKGTGLRPACHLRTPQDTSGQFPSAHSEAQTPCCIPLSGEGFVTDMETWGLTEDSVNCQALRNFRRTAKVSMY